MKTKEEITQVARETASKEGIEPSNILLYNAFVNGFVIGYNTKEDKTEDKPQENLNISIDKLLAKWNKEVILLKSIRDEYKYDWYLNSNIIQLLLYIDALNDITLDVLQTNWNNRRDYINATQYNIK